MKQTDHEITFDCIGNIELEKDSTGRIKEFLPQSRYDNRSGLRLHKYGHGPFCKFRINNDYKQAGVYIFSIDSIVKYIGECQNLSQRMNAGYGNISPRNCFEGGQPTNCRINNMFLEEIKKGKRIDLFFHKANNRKKLESALIKKFQPQWNLHSKN